MVILAFLSWSLLLFYILDVLLCLRQNDDNTTLINNEKLKVGIIISFSAMIMIIFIVSEKIRNVAVNSLFIVFKDFVDCVIKFNSDKTYDIILILFIISLIFIRLLLPKNIWGKGTIINVVELSIPITFLFLSIFSLTYFRSFNKFFVIFGLTAIPLIIKCKNNNIILGAVFYSLLAAMAAMIGVVMLYIIVFVISGVIAYFLKIIFPSVNFDYSDNEIDIPSNNFPHSNKPHWYDERGKVRDPNGNEYKVGRSGDYIKDSSGNWIRVLRDSNGDPYFENNSDKIWLQ